MSNGHCIHLFQEGGETFCIPKQITEFRKFAAYAMVWDADKVSITVSAHNHMKIRTSAGDLCLIAGIRSVDKADVSPPRFFPFSPCQRALIFHSFPPHIRFWLLTAARITSASIVFFSICDPRARASVIRLSISLGLPWAWLWMAESAA